MKLIPKARPVRIRILSGGMEHSTLSSLKEHFYLEDVMRLIANGSLTRWLRQCGESDLAGVLGSMDDVKDIDVLKIFFPELKECQTELDMITKMNDMGLKKDSAFLFERDYANDVEAIKKVYPVLECDWKRIIGNLCETNTEMALMYAKEWGNGKFDVNNRHAVEMVLDNTIEHGSMQAPDLKKTYDPWLKYHTTDRFKDVDKDKMKPIIMKIFRGETLRAGDWESLSKEEKAIGEFAYRCLEMSLEMTSASINRRYIFKKFEEFKQTYRNSIIGPEIKLVDCILFGKNNLASMKDQTPLIEFYLNNTSFFQRKRIKDKLQFILEHLFDKKIKV